MKLHIELDYDSLNKIITESATMRSLLNVTPDPLKEFVDKFLIENKIVRLAFDNHKNIGYKIPFVKELRSAFDTSQKLHDYLMQRGVDLTQSGGLSLKSAAEIANQYE